jgi:hypothetical protein
MSLIGYIAWSATNVMEEDADAVMQWRVYYFDSIEDAILPKAIRERLEREPVHHSNVCSGWKPRYPKVFNATNGDCDGDCPADAVTRDAKEPVADEPSATPRMPVSAPLGDVKRA